MNTVQDQTGATQQGAQQNGQNALPARRMLYRSLTDKIVGGVCGGIAEYLGINPVLVRVIWIVATFATWGGGFLAYLMLALFLPIGDNRMGQVAPPAVQLSQQGITWAAGILVGLGAFWLLANLGILPGLWGAFWTIIGVLFWPTLLIGAGYLLWRANTKRNVDQDIADATAKVKGAMGSMGEKLPSGDQVKDGFTNLRNSVPVKRSTTNRVFMGVCGGLGERYGIDPNLLRLIWAAFAVGTLGLGAMLYAVVGLFMPDGNAPIVPVSNQAQGAVKVQDIDITDGSAN
jgi:phage shock protein PspC (stress-responsive transcriptional regulator)